jgi:hypothetical protein
LIIIQIVIHNEEANSYSSSVKLNELTKIG